MTRLVGNRLISEYSSRHTPSISTAYADRTTGHSPLRLNLKTPSRSDVGKYQMIVGHWFRRQNAEFMVILKEQHDLIPTSAHAHAEIQDQT